MTQKLIIVLANFDPSNPGDLSGPILQASVAASMSYAVDVICTGTAARVLKNGVASELPLKPGDPRTLYDFIKEACEAGVKFFCWTPDLALLDLHKEDLISECKGVVGAAHFIEEIMSANRVLTY